MNTFLIFLTVIFGAILISEAFEFEDEKLSYQSSDDDNSYISYKPKIGHKLRRKRDESQRYCGSVLNKKVAEVCNSCSRNPNTNPIKRKRDISPFLEQKIRTKRDEGISTLCCKKGCTTAQLKSYCC